jgi:hypothetical protein
MDYNQKKQYTGKYDEEQNQTILCCVVGFCLYQIEKRFSFPVPDRKR